MGVRITSDEGVYALFDSVTGWAFGPTFAAPEDADAFLAYLHEQDEDGRELSQEALSKRHEEWLALDGNERPQPYKVGDPDPTGNNDPACMSTHEAYLCTWAPGHRGLHVAGTGDEVVAVWS